MPYSETTDLVLGDIPIGSFSDPGRYVQDAADEIDSRIGFIYQTPVDVSDDSTTSRPARLLLKRINNFLASGRLLLSVDVANENANSNAYGMYLVREANAALSKIEDGRITLDGALLIDSGAAPSNQPLQYNEDDVSAVDAFYGDLTSPYGLIDARRGLPNVVYPRAGG